MVTKISWEKDCTRSKSTSTSNKISWNTNPTKLCMYWRIAGKKLRTSLNQHQHNFSNIHRISRQNLHKTFFCDKLKKQFTQVFSDINAKQMAEQELFHLKQTKLAAAYAAKF